MRIKKKALSIVLLAALVIALAGCGGAKPEDTVSKYLDAAKKLDTETMTSCILPSNQEDIAEIEEITGEGSENEYIKHFTDYIKSNAQKMTYNIAETKVTEDTAVITVDCKYIDGGPILKATIGEAFTKMMGIAFSGVEQTEEEMNQMFFDILKEQSEIIGEKYKEATVDVSCVQQEGKWYIAEVGEDLEDVVTLGLVSVSKELEENFAWDDAVDITP